MATRRKARICIRNNTDRTLKAVCLRHRGADGGVHVGQWSDIPEGAISSPLYVEYEAGLVSQGPDWWLITWVYADGSEIYVTDPSNVSEAVDAMRVKIAAVMPDFERQFDSAYTGLQAEELLDAIADGVVRSARLSGWKEHTLRRAEADRTMTIEIEPNNEVVFRSRSGESRSRTVTSALRAAS